MKDMKLRPKTEVIRFYKMCKDIKENVDFHLGKTNYNNKITEIIINFLYSKNIYENSGHILEVTIVGLPLHYPNVIFILDMHKFTSWDVLEFWKSLELLVICMQSLSLINKDIIMRLDNEGLGHVSDYFGLGSNHLKPERMGLDSIYFSEEGITVDRKYKVDSMFQDDTYVSTVLPKSKSRTAKRTKKTTKVSHKTVPISKVDEIDNLVEEFDISDNFLDTIRKSEKINEL